MPLVVMGDSIHDGRVGRTFRWTPNSPLTHAEWRVWMEAEVERMLGERE